MIVPNDKKSNRSNFASLIVDKTVLYFHLFGVEYILQDLLNKVKDTSVTHIIFRIKDNDSIMKKFYCLAFIEYILPKNVFYIIH